MPNSHDTRAPARDPTPFSDLNAVLAQLVSEARRLLGDNFVGAYLQGSFAVGDADRFSDCDFIVVLKRDLTPDEIGPLQAMHLAIHELPNPWHNQLEGSYVPAAILKRWSTTPRDPPDEPRGEDWGDPGMSGSPARAYPFWYLDHGSKVLVRSEHDNSPVVRWCLREKGVTLAGPEPRRLIDPVTPDMLRAEIRHTMALCEKLDLQPMDLAAWQVFWVGLYCRMLHTLVTGKVGSKHASLGWAEANLDPAWSGLIGRAKALRKGMPEAANPADPDDVEATRRFVRYCLDWAEHRFKAQEAAAQRLALARAGRPGFDPRAHGGARGGQHTPAAFRPNGRGRRG